MKKKEHSFTLILVVLIFFMICTSAVYLIIFGSKVFNNTSDKLENNYNEFTLLQYLNEKVKQNDEEGAIYLTKIDDTNVLALEDKDLNVITYIYYYDGYLRELYTYIDGIKVLEAGQRIGEVDNVIFEEIDDTILVTLNNNDNTLQIILRGKTKNNGE